MQKLGSLFARDVEFRDMGKLASEHGAINYQCVDLPSFNPPFCYLYLFVVTDAHGESESEPIYINSLHFIEALNSTS